MQARADAQAAVEQLLVKTTAADGVGKEAEMAVRLGMAYLRLGEACMAQAGHSDRDCVRAYEASCSGSCPTLFGTLDCTRACWCTPQGFYVCHAMKVQD